MADLCNNDAIKLKKNIPEPTDSSAAGQEGYINAKMHKEID